MGEAVVGTSDPPVHSDVPAGDPSDELFPVLLPGTPEPALEEEETDSVLLEVLGSPQAKRTSASTVLNVCFTMRHPQARHQSRSR